MLGSIKAVCCTRRGELKNTMQTKQYKLVIILEPGPGV